MRGLSRLIITSILAILTSLFLIALPINTPHRTMATTLTGWQEQQSGTTEDLWGVSAVDANTAWAVGDNGTILKTIDGGVTWNSQKSGVTDYLRGVVAVDSKTAWAVGDNGAILKTEEGGATWISQPSGTSVLLHGISAVNASIAWAVGDSGTILKTIDGGVTWNSQTSGTIYTINEIFAVDENVAWAACGGVLKTTNGGATWIIQDISVFTGLYAVAAVDAQTAWAVGSRGSILNTDDGGATWTSHESGTHWDLLGVAVVDTQAAWAVGGQGALTDLNRVTLKTTDGGETWQSQATGHEWNLYGVSAVDSDIAWAVGKNGTITYTTGGGKECRYFFAEGYTGEGFQEYLCLGNPQEETAQVIITYMFGDGVTEEQIIQVPPSSRITVDVNSCVGEDKEVSAEVLSDREIVAERPMYFSYQGIWTGGHSCLGATSTDNYWCFAEGYTGPGFEEYICVLNLEDRNTYLTFSFQTQEVGLIEIKDHFVPPRSRSTFKVNELLGGTAYQTSLELMSNGQVVAERAMYFDYAGLGDHHWTGGHCVMGINSLVHEYYFAEGTTRAGFEEWLCLQNPDSGPLEVQATFQLGEGQGDPIEKTYVIEEDKRLTVYVPEEVGVGKDVSIEITSKDCFLAERPTYFSYTFDGLSAQGGHCVIGASAPSSEWFFAEGCTLQGFQEWLCLQNPGTEDATVQIKYFTQEEGALSPKEINVPAGTRKTIMVNEDAGPNYQLSTYVKVVNGTEIIVERPMYFNNCGCDGGHDVLGYET